MQVRRVKSVSCWRIFMHQKIINIGSFLTELFEKSKGGHFLRHSVYLIRCDNNWTSCRSVLARTSDGDVSLPVRRILPWTVSASSVQSVFIPTLPYTQHSNNNHFTALCPGLPGWAGTRRNTHPPTIPIIIQSLSASSIYHVFGTVCRSTSRLHRLFPPSEAVWRLTSSAAAIQLSSPRSDFFTPAVPVTVTTIHSILLVQIMCLAIFLHNLFPCPLLSTSWSGALCLIFHTFLHPISIPTLPYVNIMHACIN